MVLKISSILGSLKKKKVDPRYKILLNFVTVWLKNILKINPPQRIGFGQAWIITMIEDKFNQNFKSYVVYSLLNRYRRI